MIDRPLQLRPLQPGDENSFLEAVAEFRHEAPAWDFALGFEDSIGFTEYIRKVNGWPRGEGLPSGFVPGLFYVGVVNNVVVGRVSVRFRLNDFLSRVGGHIGYGVRPTQRQRGYATEMLRQALPLCAAQGIERALVTCDVDNVGSIKVIERCGGVLEGITSDPELQIQRRRYWINASGAWPQPGKA
jgi:predicted acetyltransferase